MGLVLLDEEDRSRVAKGSAMAQLLEQEERKILAPQSEDRLVYSPVTFQDIARRSIGNSPIKASGLPKGMAAVCRRAQFLLNLFRGYRKPIQLPGGKSDSDVFEVQRLRGVRRGQ